MTSTSPGPKLPMWIFFATDAVLVGAAALIWRDAGHPMTEHTALAITACVLGGAIVGLVPLIVAYERQKNELLDDRQRALEALARTVSTSAEQISIAAGGMHEIAELAQKNLRQAEQLPHKLQEKMAEFQAQLANANEVEKEELEKELEELRASESERLQSASDKIAKTAAELVKLEAAVHQHVTAANDALGKLGMGTANAIGKAQAAAEQALSQARQEAARGMGDASGSAVKAIEAAKAAALSDVTAQVDAAVARLSGAARDFDALIAKLEAAAKSVPPPASVATSATEASDEPATVAAAEALSGSPDTSAVAAPPKRARRKRDDAPPAAPANGDEPPPAVVVPTPAAEPAPVPAATIPEVAPVVPGTITPFPAAPATNADSSVPADAAAPAPVMPAPGPAAEPTPAPTLDPAAEAAAEPDAPKPARKRPAKRADEDQPALGLELEESRADEPVVAEQVLSSDGATRLVVTAYIGIGNRLFVRGSGPGLSWDKGVPLQFVSIGKWRWETNDASGPVQLKLLKNDEQESAGLGTLTVEPGHQHEVTATF